MVPFTFKDDQWIGFDNKKSLIIKVNKNFLNKAD